LGELTEDLDSLRPSSLTSFQGSNSLRFNRLTSFQISNNSLTSFKGNRNSNLGNSLNNHNNSLTSSKGNQNNSSLGNSNNLPKFPNLNNNNLVDCRLSTKWVESGRQKVQNFTPRFHRKKYFAKRFCKKILQKDFEKRF
jgi:hypothetical protein